MDNDWQAAVYRTCGPAFVAAAQLGLRPVAEVRRLRQLVIDAEPHVPDSEQTRTMDCERGLAEPDASKRVGALAPRDGTAALRAPASGGGH